MEIADGLLARVIRRPVEGRSGRATTAAEPQRRRRFRNFVARLHRWFGLFAAVWLFGIALTGSLIAFNGEIDAALNADLFTATGPGPLAPVLADAERRLDGGTISYVLYVRAVPGLVTVSVVDRNGDRAQYFYDRGTGRFNGARATSAYGVGRRDVMRTAYSLHHSFLGGRILEVFLGLIAVGWAVTQLLTQAIAFTSRSRWRDSFRVRPTARGHKRNFDLHRALGLWLYPVTLMLAVSGAYLNLPREFTAAVAAVAPVDGRYEPPQAPSPAKLSLADAAARFDTIAAPYPVTSFSYDKAAGQFRARMRDPRDLSDNGQRIVWLSNDGRVVSDRHELQGGAGDVFLAWQFPLHSGRALGLGGRVLIAFAGIVICIGIVTGILIWSKRRRQRTRILHKGGGLSAQ